MEDVSEFGDILLEELKEAKIEANGNNDIFDNQRRRIVDCFVRIKQREVNKKILSELIQTYKRIGLKEELKELKVFENPNFPTFELDKCLKELQMEKEAERKKDQERENSIKALQKYKNKQFSLEKEERIKGIIQSQCSPIYRRSFQTGEHEIENNETTSEEYSSDDCENHYFENFTRKMEDLPLPNFEDIPNYYDLVNGNKEEHQESQKFMFKRDKDLELHKLITKNQEFRKDSFEPKIIVYSSDSTL